MLEETHRERCKRHECMWKGGRRDIHSHAEKIQETLELVRFQKREKLCEEVVLGL